MMNQWPGIEGVIADSLRPIDHFPRVRVVNVERMNDCGSWDDDQITVCLAR